MKGAIIYFSGTGNTEYIGELFLKEFEVNNIHCDMIDIRKRSNINNTYDFLVFGCPIYAGDFPHYYYDWIKTSIPELNLKCLVFSTQGGDSGSGADNLAKLLKEKGYGIIVQDFIRMPSNYSVVTNRMPTLEIKESLKANAVTQIKSLVEKFINNEQYIKSVPEDKQLQAMESYKGFYIRTQGWAKSSLSIDPELCIKCGKCASECPTGNILREPERDFGEGCISCQRCVHSCPTNAFMYQGKHFEQYSLK